MLLIGFQYDTVKLQIERHSEISCNDLETEEEIIGDLGLEFQIDEAKNIFFRSSG